MAIICALTALVAEIYQTPDPALTIYCAFFLNREDRTLSLILDFALMALVTLIIGYIIIVAIAVADYPMWRVIAIAATSFCLLFTAAASKLGPIGAILALIAGFGLDKLGTLQVGEVATRGYLYAWLFGGIPAGVSIVVNLLVAPAPRRLAEREIASSLRLCAAVIRTPTETNRHRLQQCLSDGAAKIQGWLKFAGLEKTSPNADIAALRQAARSIYTLLSAIDMMDRTPEAQLPAAAQVSLARALDEMAAILLRGGYPVAAGWQALGDARPRSPLAVAILDEIEKALAEFAEPQKPDPVSAEKKEGFFKPDAFTNPDYVHYALKTTSAAVFCYILYSLLDWPGIHTCFITCYIVGLSTTAETIEKLTLRIVGCLIGAAAGIAAIVFLMPSLTSIGVLMVAVFIAAFISAYVVGGSPRISYAGFQIAFAFFLCVVQGSGPAFDMTIARDRAIGILIGNVVSYLIFANLWPISVGKRIDPAFAALLRGLSAMMTTTNRSVRSDQAIQAQSALAVIRGDIDLTHYEPSTIRPSPDWLELRRTDASEIAALQVPLLLSADQDQGTSAYIARRLETLANRFGVAATEAATAHAASRTEWTALPLFGIIDAILRRLERAAGQHFPLVGA